MRLRKRTVKWALLEGFKAGKARRRKAAGAALGPEWLKGWRAAAALRKQVKPMVVVKGRRQ